jgi:hypothetical protein
MLSHFLAICVLVGFMLVLIFDPEDGGDMSLRNIGSTDYMALYPADRALHGHRCEILKPCISASLISTINCGYPSPEAS